MNNKCTEQTETKGSDLLLHNGWSLRLYVCIPWLVTDRLISYTNSKYLIHATLNRPINSDARRILNWMLWLNWIRGWRGTTLAYSSLSKPFECDMGEDCSFVLELTLLFVASTLRVIVAVSVFRLVDKIASRAPFHGFGPVRRYVGGTQGPKTTLIRQRTRTIIDYTIRV